MTVERRVVRSRQEWLGWRKQDLTASDLGAVHGCDRNRRALQVYGEKTGQLAPPMQTNPMRRGRWLEPAILFALREEYPDLIIEPAGVYLRDPELRLGATPDFIGREPDSNVVINIQGKVVARDVFERDWADGVPLSIELQTLAEGMLLGAGTSMVAALVIDTYTADLVVKDVPRHADAEAGICTLAKQFWANIAAGVRPTVDYTKDADIIPQLYPHAEPDSTVDLSGDNRLIDLLTTRQALLATRTATQADLDAIDAEIKDKLGATERASAGAWRLTWKDEARKAYSVPAWSGRGPLRIREVAT